MQWFSGSEHQAFRFEAGPAGALLIHGFMGTPAEMIPLGRAFADAGISAWGPLLPGFGADIARLSQMREADWLTAAAEALAALSEEHAPIVLLGFSMGAAVAINLAATQRADRLILLAPLWQLMQGDWRIRLLPLLKHVVRTVRPFQAVDFRDPALRQFLAGAAPDITLDDPGTQARLRQQLTLATATLDALRRLGASTGRLAPHITLPTLVLQGTADPVVLAPLTRSLVERFAGPTSLREVDAGHMLVEPGTPIWPQVVDEVIAFAQGDAA